MTAPFQLGVLAFGDSITNGGGELQWGVALQSWAMWTARSLGLPYTGFAVDGAGIADLVSEQLPAFAARSADPGARYDVGCLYIGVNDVRARDWNPDAYAGGLTAAVEFLTSRCQRTLVASIPLGLGVPPAGPKVVEANAIIARVAARAGALVLDLSDFGARNQLMADRVHPTAFGQVAIARRALAVLAADGLGTRVDPAALIDYETTWTGRLRGDLSYGYRSLKEHGRGWLARVRVSRAGGRSPR